VHKKMTSLFSLQKAKQIQHQLESSLPNIHNISCLNIELAMTIYTISLINYTTFKFWH
jgi:hypothetical protein